MDEQVRPIGKTCEASGKELLPGSVCHSVLLLRGGKIVRLDFSEEEWTGPPSDSIGSWQTTVPETTETKRQPLDTEALFRCFEQMTEDANPAQEKLRYILALLLVRKRRLKIDGSRRDGEIEFLEFIGSQGEGPFDVPEQVLSEDEMKQLQNELNGQVHSHWT